MIFTTSIMCRPAAVMYIARRSGYPRVPTLPATKHHSTWSFSPGSHYRLVSLSRALPEILIALLHIEAAAADDDYYWVDFHGSCWERHFLMPWITFNHHQFTINLFAIFSYQIADIYHAMAGHQKNTSSTSWRPIFNRTVVNILLRKNKQWNKRRKKTNKTENKTESNKGHWLWNKLNNNKQQQSCIAVKII